MNCSPPVSPEFPSKNTGMGCHSLLQGIFQTQELNPGLPHCRRILYQLSHPGSSPFYYIQQTLYTCKDCFQPKVSSNSICNGLSHKDHSSTLTWNIPWTEEPGRLQSMGSWRVGHDWATSLSLFTFMHWRRKWQPTPVFLSGESQGWGHTESGTTEVT